MTSVVSEDSLKRIAGADDLLATALARLRSAERMRLAPTVGVVEVLFNGVRKLPATVPGGVDDELPEHPAEAGASHAANESLDVSSSGAHDIQQGEMT